MTECSMYKKAALPAVYFQKVYFIRDFCCLPFLFVCQCSM